MFRRLRILSQVAAISFILVGCAVGVPSPLKTGSWYYGEIDKDHIGFDIVFPWASRKPKVEPKVNKPQ